MGDDLFIEMEASQYTKSGQAACGDDVRFQTVEREHRHLCALSDGPFPIMAWIGVAKSFSGSWNDDVQMKKIRS